MALGRDVFPFAMAIQIRWAMRPVDQHPAWAREEHDRKRALPSLDLDD